MRILYSIVYHACMEIEFGMDGSERSFIYEDSTERKLESMYLVISFYFDIPSLINFVCLNRLGCLAYKYVLLFIVERFVTRPIQTHLVSQVPLPFCPRSSSNVGF